MQESKKRGITVGPEERQMITERRANLNISLMSGNESKASIIGSKK